MTLPLTREAAEQKAKERYPAYFPESGLGNLNSVSRIAYLQCFDDMAALSGTGEGEQDGTECSGHNWAKGPDWDECFNCGAVRKHALNESSNSEQ